MKFLYKKIIVFTITLQAKIILKKYRPKIIATTGSVGKTSAKDAIFEVVSKKYYSGKSEKSYNSETGIPLAILRKESGWNNVWKWLDIIIEGFLLIIFKNHYPKLLVLEVGAGEHPGDIPKVSKWLKPDIVVGTKMGEIPVHVEFYKSASELLEEKSHLFTSVASNGVLVLNIDDKDIYSMADKVNVPIISYGKNQNATLRIENEEYIYENNTIVGINFKAIYNKNSVPIRLRNIIGLQSVYAAAAALAVGTHLGVNLIKGADALSRWTQLAGRMRIIPGIRESTIIDDTYNSSPVAVEAALSTLKNIRSSGKKIAILGDMLELGKFTKEAHYNIGKIAGEFIDLLFVVGDHCQFVVDGALAGGLSEKNIYQFESSRLAGKDAEKYLKTGDIVLVKGSQGVRMERAVREIMANPEFADKLLVRQEEEWWVR